MLNEGFFMVGFCFGTDLLFLCIYVSGKLFECNNCSKYQFHKISIAQRYYRYKYLNYFFYISLKLKKSISVIINVSE